MRVRLGESSLGRNLIQGRLWENVGCGCTERREGSDSDGVEPVAVALRVCDIYTKYKHQTPQRGNKN